MATDCNYGVEASYILYLFFIFPLLFSYYVINMIKKLELHILIVLRLNLGTQNWFVQN